MPNSIAVILLLASYFGFGSQIDLKQSLGGFIVTVGMICMYLALAGITVEDSAEGSSNKKYQALVIIGWNCLTALAFSGILVVLKVNHAVNRINWHSGMAWASFIGFISALIVAGGLTVLGLGVGEAVKESDKQMLESRGVSAQD